MITTILFLGKSRVELWGSSLDGSAPWLLDWEPITNGDERGARLAIEARQEQGDRGE